jgi:hypothetical protein
VQEKLERHVHFGLLKSPHCCLDRECVGVERRVVPVDSPRKRNGVHLDVMLFVRKNWNLNVWPFGLDYGATLWV